jgi:hypothetical protein
VLWGSDERDCLVGLRVIRGTGAKNGEGDRFRRDWRKRVGDGGRENGYNLGPDS